MRRENKQRRRGFIPLIAILALLLIAGIAGGSYAYWAGSVKAPDNKPEDIVIKTGEGSEVTTTINLAQSGPEAEIVLVPSEKKDLSADPDNSVEKMEYVYNVTWVGANADVNGTTGSLTVTVGTILLGIGEEAISAPEDTFVVDVTPADSATIELGGAAVTVTLSEPANKLQYEVIAGKSFTIPLTFSVTPAP